MFKLFSLLAAEPLTGDIYQLMVPLSFKLIFNKDGNIYKKIFLKSESSPAQTTQNQRLSWHNDGQGKWSTQII